MTDQTVLIDYKEIIADWLKTHGYDGLFSDYSECGCSLDDLMPCGMISGGDRCCAGYRVPCDCGEGHDFHIQQHKPS